MEGDVLRPGHRVAIAASGGKDSTVLAYILKKLNVSLQLWLASRTFIRR